jgi:uncharacterized protein YegJ (DUF2314 family)
MSPHHALRAIAAAALLLSGAAPASGFEEPGAGQDRSNIFRVKATDEEMEAAKAKGRSTLPQFFQRLASPAADEDSFGVKFNLTPDGDAEYIWAGDLQIDADGKLTGTLANHPLDRRFKLGQRVAIARSQIVDWAYWKSEVAQGHYTTRVILDRVSPAEAAEIRSSLGW